MRTFVTLVGVFLAGTAYAAKSNRCAEVPASVAEFDKSTRKFKGCRLTTVEKDSLHARLGLKVGSVVMPSSKYKIDRDSVELELYLSKSDETSERSESAGQLKDCSRFEKVPAEGCVDISDSFMRQ